MRWRTGRRSENIEDRRGTRTRTGRGLAGGGIGTVVLVLVAMYFGVDPSVIMQGMSGAGQTETTTDAPYRPSAAEKELADFVAVVLGDTEDTWREQFRELGHEYEEPTLVLFSGAVRSACGFAQAAMGPFYCPGDRKVYIDLSFYRDLRDKLGAPGDFAQAYVIAHEVGHHIQTLLGVSSQVRQAQQRLGKVEANALSVRQELQADCLAGVWAHHAQRTRQILEEGDIEEGINAASAIGDDRLQKQSRGHVTPDSFTHGSSRQRVRWFTRGLERGSVEDCDTFAAERV